MNPSPHILEGTQENFDRLVLENSRRGLVVVDFWAPWVGPSLKQQEIFARLVKHYAGRFLLVSINTDEQKPLAERFGVRSLPSFKLFLNGKMVGEYHGVQPEADYPKIIETFVTRQLDEIQQQAIAAWQSGRADEALQILANAIMEDPRNLGLPALMGKILIRQDRYDEAHKLFMSLPEAARDADEIRDLLTHVDLVVTARTSATAEALEARLDGDPEDPSLRYQLAAVELMDDRPTRALDLLLEMTRRHSAYRNGIARKAMKIILDRMDAQDPQVARYRRELFRLNY
ncbi:MAG: tetratricopeptide repeat protein [Candidatus Thiodiazotropha sp.]|jgi:putative thioredoxin